MVFRMDNQLAKWMKRVFRPVLHQAHLRYPRRVLLKNITRQELAGSQAIRISRQVSDIIPKLRIREKEDQ